SAGDDARPPGAAAVHRRRAPLGDRRGPRRDPLARRGAAGAPRDELPLPPPHPVRAPRLPDGDALVHAATLGQPESVGTLAMRAGLAVRAAKRRPRAVRRTASGVSLGE